MRGAGSGSKVLQYVTRVARSLSTTRAYRSEPDVHHSVSACGVRTAISGMLSVAAACPSVYRGEHATRRVCKIEAPPCIPSTMMLTSQSRSVIAFSSST